MTKGLRVFADFVYYVCVGALGALEGPLKETGSVIFGHGNTYLSVCEYM